jgi:hypothetical protein
VCGGRTTRDRESVDDAGSIMPLRSLFFRILEIDGVFHELVSLGDYTRADFFMTDGRGGVKQGNQVECRHSRKSSSSTIWKEGTDVKENAEAVRVARVRQLFEARFAEERTETGVLLFNVWVKKHYPELLPKEKQGDPYQHLKVDLTGLYE